LALRSFSRFCAVLLVSLAAWAGGCATKPPATAKAPATAKPAAAAPKSAPAQIREQAVRFPGADVELSGILFEPAPAAAGGERRPAAVLMHGCGGMLTSRGLLPQGRRDWAERMARRGYVALMVDSFTPRGFRSVCEIVGSERPAQPWETRVADAYAALDYLVTRADVDPKHVLVVGWSHGGSTVTGVVRPEALGRRVTGPHFRAAIAFYPGCTRPLRLKSYRTTMPMLILHGEEDDWTPVAPCIALAETLKSSRFPPELIVYPGAYHGFDAPGGRVIYRPNVYNPRAPGGRGAYVGGHEPSRLKAIEDVNRFLDRNFSR
jgi:dienelactone hydrolase